MSSSLEGGPANFCPSPSKLVVVQSHENQKPRHARSFARRCAPFVDVIDTGSNSTRKSCTGSDLGGFEAPQKNIQVFLKFLSETVDSILQWKNCSRWRESLPEKIHFGTDHVPLGLSRIQPAGSCSLQCGVWPARVGPGSAHAELVDTFSNGLPFLFARRASQSLTNSCLLSFVFHVSHNRGSSTRLRLPVRE